MSLKDLIADVNVNEICEHIETETLSEWVNTWQEAALTALLSENEKLRAELEQKSKLIAQQAAELERRDTVLKEQEAEAALRREQDE